MSFSLYGTLGLVAVCIGAISSAIGLNLIKSSAIFESNRSFCQRRRFLLGMFLTTVINTSLDTFAFSFVPVSVIAPCGGICVVTSATLAHRGVFGPKELLSRAQWFSLATIVCGVILVGSFGPRPLPVTNATLVLDNFESLEFVFYQLVWALLTAVAYIGLYFCKFFTKTSLWTTLLFGGSAGMSSGITQCIMKVITSISAGATIMHGAEYALEYFPWTKLQLWRAILQLIISALLLLHSMKICICSTDVSISTAVYQSSLIIGSIFAGCAFWGDLDNIAPLFLAMFLIGIIFVILGVFRLLSHHKNKLLNDGSLSQTNATCDITDTPHVSTQDAL